MNQVPSEITLEDKNLLEQLKLIHQLEQDDRNMIYRMIDPLISKKKFKEFFQQQLAN